LYKFKQFWIGVTDLRKAFFQDETSILYLPDKPLALNFDALHPLFIDGLFVKADGVGS
jgi:hypothetical protein